MKKYFIILIFVFAFSMNAMAQHLFPEVHFTWTDSNGNEIEYMVPAWDALTTNKERVQKVIPDGGGDGPGGDDGGGDDTGGDDTGGDDTGGDGIVDDDGGSSSAVEPDPDSPGWGTGGGGAPGEDIIFGAPAKVIRRAQARPMDGIIVASACAIDTRGVGFDGYNPRGGFSPTTIVINGTNYNATTVTYGKIFGTSFDSDLGAQRLLQLDVTITGDETGNYTIPETVEPFSQDEGVSIYNIVGIDDAAYYTKSFSVNGGFFRATSLTIPKHIKSLGRRCFQACGNLTKITFADDSEIEELPEGCFAHCMNLKEIYIPASVTKLQAGALGGCGGLGKIVFAADQSPETINSNAFVKLGESTALDLVKPYCAVWVNSMEILRAFRNDNAIWNDFAFCIPFEMKKQLISYCSDLNISPSPLVLGQGQPSKPDKWKENDPYTNGPAWTVEKTGQLGGETLKVLYLNSKKTNGKYTNLDPQEVNGQKTVKLYQLETSVPQSGDGILITGDPGIRQMYVRAVGQGNAMTRNNFLVGTLVETDMTTIINDTSNDIFLLKDGTFHLCTGGMLAANKAYLKLPKEIFGRTNAKDINIVFGDDDDETDGIRQMDNVKLTIENGVVYDLQGRIVSTNGIDALPKGIYIMNGKKYVFE